MQLLQLDKLEAPEDIISSWPEWPRVGRNDASALVDGGIDAAALLWGDLDVLRAPHSNSARVLVALALELASRRPLKGEEQEFLDLFDEVVAFDPGAFTDVWSDPRAYFWTRVARDLFAACTAQTELEPSTVDYCNALGWEPGPEALQNHLDQFKAFALGMAIRGGIDRTFATPLRVELPFAIPGSRLSLDGPDPLEIIGFNEGLLQVRNSEGDLAIPLEVGTEFAADSVTLFRCPVAEEDGYELWMHPHAFNVPGLAIAEPALRAGFEYHESNAPLFGQALSCMHRYAPERFVSFRHLIKTAAVKPLSWGGFDDFSEPTLPGSFVASVWAHPIELADHLIHEFQHNRLSCIEETGPLFDSTPSPTDAAGYYSPWRDKPRGLYGLFHGVYVFVAVSDYWLHAYEDESLMPPTREYVTDRLVRLPLQLALGVAVLGRYGRYTPLGQTILDQLGIEVTRIRKRVADAGLPQDAPAINVTEDGKYVREKSREGDRPLTAREAVTEHLKLYDAGNQATGVLEGSSDPDS